MGLDFVSKGSYRGAFRTYDHPELTISGNTPIFAQVIRCSFGILVVVPFFSCLRWEEMG
jgi:hypothetical protein